MHLCRQHRSCRNLHQLNLEVVLRIDGRMCSLELNNLLLFLLKLLPQPDDLPIQLLDEIPLVLLTGLGYLLVNQDLPSQHAYIRKGVLKLAIPLIQQLLQISVFLI